MMDREERSVICSCAVKPSAPSSVLRIATAFSKGMHSITFIFALHVTQLYELYKNALSTGTVDIGHLTHPVLMHLQTFFELWDSFTMQAVHSGQPYISDHIMFEVRALSHSLSELHVLQVLLQL